MIDPGTVEVGTELWLKYRPWLRMRAAIRNRVNVRRARLGKPALPAFIVPPTDAKEGVQETSMDETKLTIIRTVLKFVAGVLAAHGYLQMGDVSVFQTAAEGVISGAVLLGGMVWSHHVAVATAAVVAAATAK